MDRTEITESTTVVGFRAAFSVVRQLRDHLTNIVAVSGVVIRTNLYNGRHPFVRDLVTDENHRSRTGSG